MLISFVAKKSQCPAPFSLRMLGHALLCGVLYVAYQSMQDALGNYMLCALFKDHLLLAASRLGGLKFEIVAIISLNDLQVDKADNGKGGSDLYDSANNLLTNEIQGSSVTLRLSRGKSYLNQISNSMN